MALRDRLTLVSFLLLVASGTLSAVLLGYAALVVGGAFLAGTLVAALLELAFPVLPLFALSTAVAVVSAVGVVYGLARRASLPRGGRIESVARRAESEYPPLRALGLGDAFAEPEPSPEEKRQDALERLKRRYVDGELTEREFERKLGRLVANDSVDDARAERERAAVVEDGGRSRF
ncbi:Short C-terminal domain-containing protein [Halogeometricum rufum]|uniref:Short C-terminal domain-containing protein n=1 Tax=Halogeometricum rufum TaxID=553469 RepID=A0A1I6I2W8_9EURY|nr:SHOCT domain-containing protein [Halogeometricum rufum]SFR61045.1 Short C-terminal domain-containing protein [Halogeometricum rufum]